MASCAFAHFDILSSLILPRNLHVQNTVFHIEYVKLSEDLISYGVFSFSAILSI